MWNWKHLAFRFVFGMILNFVLVSSFVNISVVYVLILFCLIFLLLSRFRCFLRLFSIVIICRAKTKCVRIVCKLVIRIFSFVYSLFAPRTIGFVWACFYVPVRCQWNHRCRHHNADDDNNNVYENKEKWIACIHRTMPDKHFFTCLLPLFSLAFVDFFVACLFILNLMLFVMIMFRLSFGGFSDSKKSQQTYERNLKSEKITGVK